MDFFGMGMGEILLVLVIALIIWGPGRIVEIGRTLGKTVRTLRKASSDLTTQISKELDGKEKDPPPRSRANSGRKTKKPSDVDKTESGGAEMASPRDQSDISGKNE